MIRASVFPWVLDPAYQNQPDTALVRKAIWFLVALALSSTSVGGVANAQFRLEALWDVRTQAD